jgi:hypothetical protein
MGVHGDRVRTFGDSVNSDIERAVGLLEQRGQIIVVPVWEELLELGDLGHLLFVVARGGLLGWMRHRGQNSAVGNGSRGRQSNTFWRLAQQSHRSPFQILHVYPQPGAQFYYIYWLIHWIERYRARVHDL